MVLEVMERIYSGHWFLQSFNCHGFVHDFHKFTGKKFFTKFAGIMENDMCQMAWDDEEFEEDAKYIADKLVNDDKWRNNIYKLFNKYSKQYFSAGKKFRKLDFPKLSDILLAKEYGKMLPLQKHHQLIAVIVNGYPTDGKNHLSNKIRDELKININDAQKFEEYWSTLTLPTRMSLRQKKDLEIAKLADKIRKKALKNPEKELAKIHKKYSWLDYLYQGPEATLEQYRNELKIAIEDNKFLKLDKEFSQRKKEQQKLMNKIGLDKRGKFLVELAKHVIWQKGWRKDYQAHAFWCYEPFFKGLAKRKGIEDWHDVSFLFPWETENFILNNQPTPEELKERRNYSIFYDTDTSTEIYAGEKARDFHKTIELKKHDGNIQETSGQCAYPGKAKGAVRIIQVPLDMKKMQKGDILVSQATSPDLLPAIMKAAAIVTNTGGLICHAAITARELKIPCIVGTHNATLIFKDGDTVEVDATKGTARKVEK